MGKFPSNMATLPNLNQTKDEPDLDWVFFSHMIKEILSQTATALNHSTGSPTILFENLSSQLNSNK